MILKISLITKIMELFKKFQKVLVSIVQLRARDFTFRKKVMKLHNKVEAGYQNSALMVFVCTQRVCPGLKKDCFLNHPANIKIEYRAQSLQLSFLSCSGCVTHTNDPIMWCAQWIQATHASQCITWKWCLSPFWFRKKWKWWLRARHGGCFLRQDWIQSEICVWSFNLV